MNNIPGESLIEQYDAVWNTGDQLATVLQQAIEQGASLPEGCHNLEDFLAAKANELNGTPEGQAAAAAWWDMQGTLDGPNTSPPGHEGETGAWTEGGWAKEGGRSDGLGGWGEDGGCY